MPHLGQYGLTKKLGAGSYGEVNLAHSPEGDLFAIKSIYVGRRNELSRQQVKNEITAMRRLKHKNIIALKEVIETSDSMHLVIEYAAGGDLRTHLNNYGELHESQARSIFSQLVAAVQLAHKNGIVHRDLKLDNILLDDNGRVKLADWGLASKWSYAAKSSEFVGSAHYAAPEVVAQRPYTGPELDCWSLGVILYSLVTASLPFMPREGESTEMGMRSRIVAGDYEMPEHISPACASLIAGLLEVDSAKRYSVENIIVHPWMALTTHA